MTNNVVRTRPSRVLRRRRFLVAAIAALAVAGCGGDDEGKQIPADQSGELRSLFGEVKRRLDPLRCNDVKQDSFPKIQAQIDALPADLDGDVRQSIEDGFEELRTLVDEECAAASPEEETTPTDTSPTETTPTETDTTPTETDTTPTETDTTPTETTPEEPPPDEDGTGGTAPPGQEKDKGNKGKAE